MKNKKDKTRGQGYYLEVWYEYSFYKPNHLLVGSVIDNDVEGVRVALRNGADYTVLNLTNDKTSCEILSLLLAYGASPEYDYREYEPISERYIQLNRLDLLNILIQSPECSTGEINFALLTLIEKNQACLQDTFEWGSEVGKTIIALIRASTKLNLKPRGFDESPLSYVRKHKANVLFEFMLHNNFTLYDTMSYVQPQRNVNEKKLWHFFDFIRLMQVYKLLILLSNNANNSSQIPIEISLQIIQKMIPDNLIINSEYIRENFALSEQAEGFKMYLSLMDTENFLTKNKELSNVSLLSLAKRSKTDTVQQSYWLSQNHSKNLSVHNPQLMLSLTSFFKSHDGLKKVTPEQIKGRMIDRGFKYNPESNEAKKCSIIELIIREFHSYNNPGFLEGARGIDSSIADESKNLLEKCISEDQILLAFIKIQEKLNYSQQVRKKQNPGCFAKLLITIRTELTRHYPLIAALSIPLCEFFSKYTSEIRNCAPSIHELDQEVSLIVDRNEKMGKIDKFVHDLSKDLPKELRDSLEAAFENYKNKIEQLEDCGMTFEIIK